MRVATANILKTLDDAKAAKALDAVLAERPQIVGLQEWQKNRRAVLASRAAVYRLPRLRKRFRSSNLLERSLEEVRRRTKVIGRFPGETSCLSLCWAVLDLVIDAAHGLGLTDLDRQQLVKLAADRQLARQHLAHTA